MVATTTKLALSITNIYLLFILLTPLSSVTLASHHKTSSKPLDKTYNYSLIDKDIIPDHVDIGLPIDIYQYSPAVTPRTITTRASQSTFKLNILNSPGAQYQKPLEQCMKLASQSWVSSKDVTVQVRFSELSSKNVLGTGVPSRNWLVDDYIVSVALAESILGEELNSDMNGDLSYDILIVLNNITSWYLGTDARPRSGTYDLVTVCLHEVYHGLMMSGGNIVVYLTTSDGNDYEGRFRRSDVVGRYDAFIGNQDGCNIHGYANNRSALGIALTSNNVFFYGNDSKKIARIYAPRPYAAGSSVYHLSQADYGNGKDLNDLMTPAIGQAYSQHNVGPLVEMMQREMLEVKKVTGARKCSVITPPEIDDTPISAPVAAGSASGSEDGGDGNGVGIPGSTGGFTIKFGDTQVNGWIVIGGGVGGFVLLIALFVGMYFAFRPQRHKGKRIVDPKQPEVARMLSNEGGLV